MKQNLPNYSHLITDNGDTIQKVWFVGALQFLFWKISESEANKFTVIEAVMVDEDHQSVLVDPPRTGDATAKAALEEFLSVYHEIVDLEVGKIAQGLVFDPGDIST